MEVSFTGIKNVGGYFTAKNQTKRQLRIVMQLTDDETKDLSMMSDVFEKFPDPHKKGFLILDNEISEERDISFIEGFKINGKNLDIKKENFYTVNKLWGLLNKIQENAIIDRDLGQKVMLPLETEYLESAECLNNYNQFGRIINAGAFFKHLFNSHRSERIEACADSFKRALLFALANTQ